MDKAQEGSRSVNGRVPNGNSNPDNRKFYLNDWYNPDNANENLRDRRLTENLRSALLPMG